MEYIKDRVDDYDANYFVNELVDASKLLGLLEAKISGYQFNGIIIPMLHKKEAISSMYIEGTQTTITDVYKNEVKSSSIDNRVMLEVKNHTKALAYGADVLRVEGFSHSFIKKIHELMLTNIVSKQKEDSLGRYKTQNNFIVNSLGKVVFTPPSFEDTQKYMDELIDYMNDTTDGVNPLIKAAVAHAQFESIHPFEDGNGRVGRLLVSLYLFRARVINFPFFYISEAISQDKAVYYNQLTGTRTGDYNAWIKFFLQKLIVQANNHIKYIDDLNNLYLRTKNTLTNCINSPKYDSILECLFTQPVLTSGYLAEKLNVSVGQANRYLVALEENSILQGDDKKRNRRFYFSELIILAERT
jgi:Fic family protein